MKRSLLAIAFALSALPAFGQGIQTVPWPWVTLPTFVIPASAVNGGGTLSTACLTFPLGTPICEDAVNVLDQRNSTTAQRFNVANSFTSLISSELFSVDWQTVPLSVLVGTRTAATGTGRNLRLMAQNDTGVDQYAGLQLTTVAPPIFKAGFVDKTFATLSSPATGTWFSLGNVTHTPTSGSIVSVAILPIYNQASGNAANTDLLVNRTQTLVGSGAQLLADFQVSTVSKWKVDNTGATTQTSTLNTAAGTTAIAPITITNGTNLTTATANAVENDGTAFYTTQDTTNGRRFDDSWNYFRLTGSGTGISTIADFYGANSGIPLVANGVYEIEFVAYFSQVTAGTATWTITTATTALANLTGEYMCSNIAGIGAVGAPQTAAINVTASSATAFPVTGTEATAVTHQCNLRVMLTAGNGASNTRLRLTMGAGTATPLINSYFRVRRLPAANTGAFVS